MINHFRVLGVKASASDDEIKKAYKRLSNKYHPDKLLGLSEDEKTAAANALLLLAVPTFLIGICKGAMMHCRMVMLPTLIVLGVLTIVFAAIAIWLDSRAAKRN